MQAGAWWALQLPCSPIPLAQRGQKAVTPIPLHDPGYSINTFNSIQSSDLAYTFIIENLVFFISKSIIKTVLKI